MDISEWPLNWSVQVPNFTLEELSCRCGCGGVPQWSWVQKLQRWRSHLGFAMPITSGFRCAGHDSRIGGAGVHPIGRACDIGVAGANALLLIQLAAPSVTGIGVKGRGPRRFVHLDDLAINEAGPLNPHPRPRLWSYDAD